MRLKVGVKLHNLQPQTLLAMQITDQDHIERFGNECTITSVNDSEHMKGSLHGLGLAFDVRTRDLLPGQDKIWFNQLRSRLGAAGYDVVLESTHIHVEYDPKD